ncbi:MAG: hypothetical protein JWP12_2455 [Bacteroidetes bacterium]|nr:hypothetical protein [Bacteroidota bacterium]
MKQETQISCPECGHNIDVNQIVYSQIADQLKLDLGKKASEEQKSFENKLRQKYEAEKNEELSSYKEELERKSEQVKDLNKTKAELERAKREKTELRSLIESETEQKLSERLNEEKNRIRKEYDEKNNLKISEKEHLIDSLKTQIQVLTRKVEQGSMQLQGEVQELEIENYLRECFPLDTIEEIKKGARGADCLQIINSRERIGCGSIYYESKRTKDFSSAWIPKFRTDMQEKNATFGVLVTDTYPKNIERMTLIDGVWVCKVDEFKGLCFVLREAVLLLNTSAITQENKGEKMHMLYDYLIGNEFRMQIESIVEGFVTMQDDLNSERRALESIWKKRQKQIEKVLLNTSHMFSTIRGIAGSSISEIKALELTEAKHIE